MNTTQIQITKNILSFLVANVDTNNPKKELNGILFDFDKSQIVATDTRCALIVYLDKKILTGSYIIDRLGLKILSKTSHKDFDINITEQNKQLLFTSYFDYDYPSKLREFKLLGTKISGVFPNIDYVLPSEFKTIIEFEDEAKLPFLIGKLGLYARIKAIAKIKKFAKYNTLHGKYQLKVNTPNEPFVISYKTSTAKVFDWVIMPIPQIKEFFKYIKKDGYEN